MARQLRNKKLGAILVGAVTAVLFSAPAPVKLRPGLLDDGTNFNDGAD